MVIISEIKKHISEIVFLGSGKIIVILKSVVVYLHQKPELCIMNYAL